MSSTTFPPRVSATFPTEGEHHSEGVWDEETSQHPGFSRVVFRYPMPIQLVEKYARLAVRHATLKRLDDNTWFAEIEGFEGVWSNEASAKEALDVLEEVVFDWAVLKIRDQDCDLPPLGDIDLNSIGT
jgi:predicted RNase H-like HicB family nuclease